MNGKSKLTHQQQAQTDAQQQTSQQQAGKEFGSVEEMLRFDAAQNPVPEKVAERLQESVAQEPTPPLQSWWKRWFGKSSGND